MLTAGVDLAAQPAGTAVATVTWSATAATVTTLVRPADDDAVTAAVRAAAVTGIDCPLGWPDEFVDFVNAHRGLVTGRPAAGPRPGDPQVLGQAWRRRLAWRRTDEVVRESTGLIPLSVSADRIAHAALRCAAIQLRLAHDGVRVRRDGTGPVAEVYPAASLRYWGLPYRGYKGAANRAARVDLVDRLLGAAPWLRLGAYENDCRTTDHALDAVVAALTARAVALGLATTPVAADRARAATEGWIVLPVAPLSDFFKTGRTGAA